MKHTPGPWHVDRDADAFGVYYVVEAMDEGDNWPEGIEGEKCRELAIAHDKANARLIASAPELYEALKAIVASNYGQPGAVHVSALDKARAILAKAGGE